MSTLHPKTEMLSRCEHTVFALYAISSLVVFILAMIFGLIMRMAQGTWISVPPDLLYQLMTAHGAAMVGTVSLAASAVMWFFLRKYVRLHVSIFVANYVLFMLGAVLILGSVFIGGFAGGWTFLYPLPVQSMSMWSLHAAVLFMLGYLLIGVGFLLFYLDAMYAIIQVYGNLGRALGMQWLFRGVVDKSHPTTVVASTMVIIVNGLGVLGGAVILVMSIVNAYVPELSIDPLLAKNLIYFFGHVFINCTIYMAVMAVYELLPRYTGRAWGVSRPFLWAWVASTVMVLIIYPHHLLMDFVMPHWMLAMGQIIGYTSGLPVFTVTVYGALTNIHRSGMRWSLPSRLIILSMFGWAAGIVPAIVDGTISVNKVMHNTLWVPGHFHFYLLLGVIPMLLALWFHLIGDREPASDRSSDKLGLIVFIIGGLVLVGSFLAAGYASVPRRFAQHLSEWVTYDQVGSAGAILVVAALLLFAVRITSGLLMTRGNVDGSTHHGS